MSKIFSKISIIIILIILAVGGICVWQYLKAPEKEVKPAGESTGDETADWKTYRDDEHGFEIKYPLDWRAHINAFAGAPNMIFCPPPFFSEKNEGWLTWTESPSINGCASNRRTWSQDNGNILIEGVGDVSQEVYKSVWQDKISKPIFGINLGPGLAKSESPNPDHIYLGKDSLGFYWNAYAPLVEFPEYKSIVNQMFSTVKFTEVTKQTEEVSKEEKYCVKDTDCACGVNKKTRACFYGNKDYVDTKQQCPDFCTSISGDLVSRCVNNECKQFRLSQ